MGFSYHFETTFVCEVELKNSFALDTLYFSVAS